MSETDKLIEAVAEFSGEMTKKLLKKMRKGFRGWDDLKCWETVRDKLEEHTELLCRGDTSQAVDVANLAMMLRYMKKEEKPKCQDCGKTEDLIYGPCPFASEIHDDDTPMWLCENCASERAQDI